ncbi:MULTISPECIES: hypothetical protein [Streptomyces]|uniref:Sigma-like protein n=1 Tax=Streptomyces prasinus TaxID=67345 RepID=A0ABX6AY37_9ACTN|nr:MULTISPECIES: hypothetical protein [Streptomyces]MCP3768749.1 hypothetical protein [Streptomyces sp. MAR25Y5]OBQ48703.1 hypothetical protein A4U61_26990 [Streptomyces sp. H-KF8]QEV06917.1 hypothetical protein CP972_15800 [Streptomyces prasinus]
MSDKQVVKPLGDIHATSEPLDPKAGKGGTGGATTQGDIHATGEPLKTEDTHATSEPAEPTR